MTDLFPTFIYILSGVAVTLKYTVIALLGGCAFGGLLAILKYKQKAVPLVNGYVSFLRGTPLLVQLTLVYFVLPSILGLPISIFVAGCIAFSLNSSAYIAEIIYAGIMSVDKGQFEVCQTLNISPFLMWKDIIFPQAIKTIFPAFMNEAITLVKETALISTLGEQDIMRRAQLVAAEHYTFIQPLLTAAICYYLLTFCLEQMGKKIQKRMAYDYC
jgi:polar amino acid transport system permease protein